MKSSLLEPRLIFSAVFITIFVSAANVCPLGCIPDSCARAVTGIVAGTGALSSRLAQCSSFMTATLYPATEVTTITSTATRYLVSGNAGYISTNVSVQVLPSSTVAPATVIKPNALPNYISAACAAPANHATARYSSACSCAGVTVSTTTLSTPSLTLTQTVNTVTTVTSFNLLVTQPSSDPSYLSDADPNDPDAYSHDVNLTQDLSLASNFTLVNGSLELKGLLLSDQDQEIDGEPLYFDLPSNIDDYNWVTVTVIVDEVTHLLSALNTHSGASIFLNCQGILYLVAKSDTIDIEDCGVVDNMQVIPL